MLNAKVISEECYAAPAPNMVSARTETSSRTMYLSNPGCTIDGAPGGGADANVLVHAKVISPECFSAP